MRRRDSAILCALVGALVAEPRASAAPPPSSKSSRDQVMRLAVELDDERTVAELMRERALGPRASQEQVLDAVQAYEGLGDPEGAVNIFRRRLARFPDERETHVQLALLLERMGKSESALPEWQAIDDKTGLTLEQALDYARALSRLGRLEDALSVLKKHSPGGANLVHAPGADFSSAYWRDAGFLAWELDDSELALDAYRRVWAEDHHAPDAALRLMTLLSEQGARDEATKVALDAYRAEKNPEFLLFIAEQYEKVEDWAAVARILDVPISEQVRFEGRD
ncbi:MAG TPA: tetratricopeptide repeat protein, partial [Polyangiaceae bacterium]|nr:tetratricopeptide repeat protein [Polyangiaceae bacterium]